MADDSTHSVEQRIVTSTWAYEKQHEGEIMRELKNDFNVWFNKAAAHDTITVGEFVIEVLRN
jgi:hypothetical protein